MNLDLSRMTDAGWTYFGFNCLIVLVAAWVSWGGMRKARTAFGFAAWLALGLVSVAFVTGTVLLVLVASGDIS